MKETTMSMRNPSDLSNQLKFSHFAQQPLFFSFFREIPGTEMLMMSAEESDEDDEDADHAGWSDGVGVDDA